MDRTGGLKSTFWFPEQLLENLPWTLRHDRNSGMNFQQFAVRITALAQMMQNCRKMNFACACMAKGPRRSAHGNSKRSPKASNVLRRAPKSGPRHPRRAPRGSLKGFQIQPQAYLGHPFPQIGGPERPDEASKSHPKTDFPNLSIRGAGAPKRRGAQNAPDITNS